MGAYRGRSWLSDVPQTLASITLYKAPYGPLVGVCGIMVALVRYQPLGSLKPSYGHNIRAEGLVRWGG